MRPFRYALVDGTQKTLIIDDSEEVDKICAAIANHVGLKNHVEFGLRYLEDKSTLSLALLDRRARPRPPF